MMRDKVHDCPNCTHIACELCKGTGYIAQSKVHEYDGKVYGFSMTNKKCPRGCPPPIAIL